MPELRWVGAPERGALHRALRQRLPDLGLVLRVLAEDLLGAEAPIDWLALDPQGGVVLVLVGSDGDDLALVGRALAQKAWVEPRLRDWRQLAPRLGLEADAPVRLLLLAPSFSAASLAAAGSLGPVVAGLATYRCVRNGGSVEVLLEPAHRSPLRDEAPPIRSTFRSGLTDADLSLTPGEREDLS